MSSLELQQFKIESNIDTNTTNSQEEYIKQKAILDVKASKYLPENTKLVGHDATFESEPTYIVYQDSIGYEIMLYTPLGLKNKNLNKLRYGGIGDLVDKYTFDEFETNNVNNDNYKAVVKDLAIRFSKDSDKKWFVISGITGSGKSHLCTAICNVLIEKGVSFEYLNWRNQARNITFNLEEYEKFVNRMSNVDVLYIDDFLKSTGEVDKISTFIKDMAGQILNNRYVNKKITLISTEWSQEELEEIDPSMSGRIYEMSANFGYRIDLGTDKTNEKIKKRNYRLYGKRNFIDG